LNKIKNIIEKISEYVALNIDKDFKDFTDLQKDAFAAKLLHPHEVDLLNKHYELVKQTLNELTDNEYIKNSKIDTDKMGAIIEIITDFLNNCRVGFKYISYDDSGNRVYTISTEDDKRTEFDIQLEKFLKKKEDEDTKKRNESIASKIVGVLFSDNSIETALEIVNPFGGSKRNKNTKKHKKMKSLNKKTKLLKRMKSKRSLSVKKRKQHTLYFN
jgi:hypothetical protein